MELEDKLLELNMDPVPRYRFLRDILGLSKDDPVMINVKEEVLQSRWVYDILKYQKSDGSFGFFHSLSMPDKYPITTEQALRRLKNLGLDYGDDCIKRAVSYMEGFLNNELDLPDRKEKQCDWTTFTHLIAAAQIRRFHPSSEPAMNIAEQWKRVVEYAFSGDEFSQEKYNEAYEGCFMVKPRGGRLVDFVNFYPLTLLKGLLSKETESKAIDHVIDHEEGIYYIYEGNMRALPEKFSSKQTNRYLNALELILEYSSSREKLGFSAKWLMDNIGEDGFWDMGTELRDGVFNPLSESWRKPISRKIDYTVRIVSILKKL